MDFKVAGTTEGITGIQMDTKLKGLSLDIVEKTLNQAKDARLFILGVMDQTISSSRQELSRYAPRMYKITINQEKIGSVIGPGGKTILLDYLDVSAAIGKTHLPLTKLLYDGFFLVGSYLNLQYLSAYMLFNQVFR